jgi:hypothetical protein
VTASPPPAAARSGIVRIVGLVFTGALSLAVSACTPMRSRLEPYRDHPAEAGELAAEARAACTTLRGVADLPRHPFTTDGCSASPDGTWVDCCVQHDVAYWCGGGADARLAADRRLRECIAGTLHSPLYASVAFAFVRIGGAPWLPFSWRWAYGWSGFHGYDHGGSAVNRCTPLLSPAAPLHSSSRSLSP